MSNVKNAATKKTAKANCACGSCSCGCEENACRCQETNCHCGCGKPAARTIG